MQKRSHVVLLALFAGLMALAVSCTAAAPAYPSKAITFIFPFSPGSSGEIMSRFIAAELEKELGQKVLVEVKTGAAGALGTGEIAKAKPDGYTIGFGSVAAIILNPITQESTLYKGLGDFTPVGAFGVNNAILSVNSKSPWMTLKDLVDDAKQRPGKISVGIGAGFKGMAHVHMLLLSKWAGVQFNFVPVDTSTVPGLLGGTLDASWGGSGDVVPQVQAGTLRVLVQHLDAGTEQLKTVPTVDKLGFDLPRPLTSVIAPKGLPADVKTKLVTSVRKIAESQAFRELMVKSGVTPAYASPEEIVVELGKNEARLKQLAKDEGWTK